MNNYEQRKEMREKKRNETNLDFDELTNRPFPNRLDNFCAFLSDIYDRVSSVELGPRYMYVKYEQHVEFEPMYSWKKERVFFLFRGKVSSYRNDG